MYADVSMVISIRNSVLSNQLRSFLKRLKEDVSPKEAQALAEDLNTQTHALLTDFPQEKFWHALLCLNNVEFYETDPPNVELTLEFEDIQYPYAREFMKQLATWLTAIGCSKASPSIVHKFSLSSAMNFLNLSYEYENGQLALFIGAGVSTEFGLPLWPELQERLLSYCLDRTYANDINSRDEILKKLRGSSFPQQVRWVKRTLGDEYAQSIQRELYRDLYNHGIGNSPIAKSISKMVNLRAICTFNFDDLLERQLGKTFRTVAAPEESYRFGKEVPVYHVHGFLPYVGEPRGNLILSEDDYHAIGMDPYHWSNIVQLTLLRECTCLLIGLSCTDQNLRRILDVVNKSKAGATYTIQKMEDILRVNDDTLKTWKATKEFDRDALQDLDVRTIWIDSFDDVPKILDEIVRT